MHLINVNTIQLKETSPRQKPRYAILSHRWTKKELTFADINTRKLSLNSTPVKLHGTLQQARRDGIKYVWIDTCCINKESSNELSTAINSMYRWYQDAELCYVYLQDVDVDSWQESLSKSAWFKRSWTLQELLAPSKVVFYDRQWQLLGTKKSLAYNISKITGIPVEVLRTGDMDRCSIAQRMAWAAHRTATHVEDRAYCLMGLFGVNMPLLYGEGERAFVRLQEEIIRYNDDHSIFAWSMGKRRFSGLLAPAPDCFASSQNIVPDLLYRPREPFSMTNRGLSIKLEVIPWSTDTYLAFLDCAEEEEEGCGQHKKTRAGIFLRRLHEDDQYIRIRTVRKGLWFDTESIRFRKNCPARERQLFVRHNGYLHCDKDCLKDRFDGLEISSDCLSPSSCVIGGNRISANGRIVSSTPGDPGCIAVIDVSAQHKGLRKIALGFDFEFNPVCLLEDSFSAYDDSSIELQPWYDWSRVLEDDIEWDEIIEGGRFIRPPREIHDGLWALKGSRINGLDVLLSETFTDKGSLLSFRRDTSKSRLIWEFDIDSLVGPFRNHHHKALRSFGTRWNFQRICGLGNDVEGMEEGDEILKKLHHSINSEYLPRA